MQSTAVLQNVLSMPRFLLAMRLLLPPAAKQASLDNEEQRVGAEIVRRALPYSLKLIARNAGTNGSVVVQKVCPCGFLGPKDL